MFILFFAAIWLIGALLHLALSRQPRSPAGVLEVFLLWALIVTGLQGVFAFYGHVFNGPAVARSIGWPPGNPFQFEVGVANLGLGVLGLMCIWRRGHFWLATIIMASVFYWGAAYGHIDQIIRFQNYAPNNASAVLYSDLLAPVILIGLYAALEATKAREAKARPKRIKRVA